MQGKLCARKRLYMSSCGLGAPGLRGNAAPNALVKAFVNALVRLRHCL